MLKITMVDGPLERRLVLEGRLMEPELSALQSAWEDARRTLGTRKCLVDLREATFIDLSGERILLKMKGEGARFIACGVSTTHQLEQLGIRCNDKDPKVPR